MIMNKEEALASIKLTMQAYKIEPKELAPKRTSKLKGVKLPVKYKDEHGNTWSGRGVLPKWLAGRNKEDFRVQEDH